MTAPYGLLDVRNEDHLREYERYFYQAYARLADNKLTRLIWDWDDARQRLRARIPYEDQILYTWRDRSDRLLVLMAVNVSRAEFQGRAFGFMPDPGERSYCEVINVISTPHFRRYPALSYGAFIRDFAYRDLVSRGYNVALSTCTRRRLRPYLRMGAQFLTQTVMDGEERFFLRWMLRELVAGAPETVEGYAA